MAEKIDTVDSPLDLLTANIRSVLPDGTVDKFAQLAHQYGKALLDLRLTPAEEILSEDEIELLRKVESEPLSDVSFAQESLVIILKATRLCNLRCTYCNSWRAGPGHVMDFSILAKLMRGTLSTPGLRKLQIVWHGGEVTLLPVDYLRKALWLQERYRQPETGVDNCIQTNGTRLTEEWAEFLDTHNIAVGVSLDSTPEIHDRRRLTKAGKGSWSATRDGIRRLNKANVRYGALAVVDEHAIRQGAEPFLEGLAKLNVAGVALLNALPANETDRENSDAYLDWDAFQSFLRDMFALWWDRYQDRFEIRELQALVDAVRGKNHGLCIYAENCMGRYVTVEPNGELSACEKYVGNQDYKFGSLDEGSVAEVFSKSEKLSAAIETVDAQKTKAKDQCEYFHYCNGGCPHDDLNNQRFGKTGDGCCGMRSLIQDIKSTIEGEEKENDRQYCNAASIDKW